MKSDDGIDRQSHEPDPAEYGITYDGTRVELIEGPPVPTAFGFADKAQVEQLRGELADKESSTEHKQGLGFWLLLPLAAVIIAILMPSWGTVTIGLIFTGGAIAMGLGSAVGDNRAREAIIFDFEQLREDRKRVKAYDSAVKKYRQLRDKRYREYTIARREFQSRLSGRDGSSA